MYFWITNYWGFSFFVCLIKFLIFLDVPLSIYIITKQKWNQAQKVWFKIGVLLTRIFPLAIFNNGFMYLWMIVCVNNML